MLVFVIGLMAWFVYLDLTLLRAQDPQLFRRVFHIPSVFYLVYGLLLLMVFVITPDYFISLVMVFILPVYVFKRRRFRRQLALPVPGEPLPEDPYLAIDAFGMVSQWMLIMIGVALVGKIFQGIFPKYESPLGEMVVLTGCSYVIIMSLTAKIMKSFPHLTLRQVFGLQKNSQSWVKLWVLPVLVGLAFAGLSAALIHARAQQPATPLSRVIDQTESSGLLIVFLGVAVFLAPFFEEIIFRGFFFYVLRRFKGATVALFVIALSFGAMHVDQYWGDWMAIIAVTLLGFMLTFLRLWTGSSIPGIVTHYIYNGAMTLIPILMMFFSNPAYFEYKMQYQNLDNAKKEELLLKSIETHPDQYDSYNDLAWLYTEEGKRLSRALDLVNEALAHDPDNYAYLDTKAEVLYQLGQAEEAVAIEEKLFAKYPDDEYLQQQMEKFRQKGNGEQTPPGPE